MAEIFDFIVNDNRTITFKLSEPIMLEDNGVSDWRFHIPNIVNGLDATGWQWWLVYVNAKGVKYTIPLTPEYDYDRPDAYSIATYTVDYGMSCKVGSVKFSIEAIDADTGGGTILHEWHTKTYSATVEDTLQGNQVEYAETESDIISALLVEVRNKVNQLVGGATPLPVNLKSLMTDHDRVYLYTGSEDGESAGYWYYWNGTDFVPGRLYGAGVTDAVPTQGSNNAVSSGGVYSALHDTDTTLSQSGQAADAKKTGDEITGLKEDLNESVGDLKSAISFSNYSSFHVDHDGSYVYSDFVQGIRRQNNHDVIEAKIYRCTTGIVFTLFAGDVVKVTNNAQGQEIVITTDSTWSGWQSGSFDYTIPSDGIYWAIVKKSNESAIAPTDITATLKIEIQTLAAKALNKVDSAMNRMEDIDGWYYLDPNNFEIGGMQISASGWIYKSNNTKRVRTKEGVTYHLSVGDVISLSDYTDARFYLGWKNGNNEYKYAGWETEDYTVREAGDYVILLANVTEVDQTSIYALFDLLSIKTSNYALKEIEQEFAEQDAKLLDSFLYDRMGIPFTVNEAYISNTFKPKPNRISFDVPYPFNKGSKIDITVGTGEKFYMMYFRKVNNTGSKNTDYERISGSDTGWQTTSKSYTATEDVYVYVSAAFIGDTRITKDTVKTKAVETKAYASADVDELPAYWKTYLQTKNGEINAAMDDIGGNGDAFVFYTDPHWGSKNQKHTPQIIQNMLENTALRSVYCGGDVIGSGSGGFTEYCKAFRGIDVFTARGNHDQNPNAQDALDIVPDSEYYNRILKPIEHLVNTEGRLYFYRDNASEKIRYIFMDSGSARADTLDTAQLTWMQNALTELESDWSVLVIQHVVFTGAEASSTAPLNFAGQGTKTINAINAVWEQMQCTFIGIVCGHVHRDYATTDSTYGYPIIATSCDVGGTGRTQYDPVNGATPGTTDEHILDVFIIDKSNRTITVKRVGAGSDRSFTYPEHS